jgi:hypothetical protein
MGAPPEERDILEAARNESPERLVAGAQRKNLDVEARVGKTSDVTHEKRADTAGKLVGEDGEAHGLVKRLNGR